MTRTSAAATSVAIVAWLAAMTGAGHPSSRAPRTHGVETFPLSQVRLLDGPFKRSEALNVAYVHALEIDRLLAPFRIEAGLKPKAEPYPNWESTGLQGHTAGHYLTALAQAWAVDWRRRSEAAARRDGERARRVSARQWQRLRRGRAEEPRAVGRRSPPAR